MGLNLSFGNKEIHILIKPKIFLQLASILISCIRGVKPQIRKLKGDYLTLIRYS